MQKDLHPVSVVKTVKKYYIEVKTYLQTVKFKLWSAENVD